MAGLVAAAGGTALATPDLAGTMQAQVRSAADAFWAAGNEPPPGESADAAAQRWRAAAEGATYLESVGLQLAAPEHARPGRWAEFARMMAEAGASGRAAALTRDMDSAFEVGGRLYDACEACHEAYAPQALKD